MSISIKKLVLILSCLSCLVSCHKKPSNLQLSVNEDLKPNSFILKNQVRVKTKISDGIFFDQITPKVILLDYKNVSGNEFELLQPIKQKLINKGYKVVSHQDMVKNIGAIMEINLTEMHVIQKDKDIASKKDLMAECISVGGLIGAFTFIGMENFFVGALLGTIGTYALSYIIHNEPMECIVKAEINLSMRSENGINSDNQITLNRGTEGKEYLKWQEEKFKKTYRLQVEKSIKTKGAIKNITNVLKYSMINTIGNIVN